MSALSSATGSSSRSPWRTSALSSSERARSRATSSSRGAASTPTTRAPPPAASTRRVPGPTGEVQHPLGRLRLRGVDDGACDGLELGRRPLVAPARVRPCPRRTGPVRRDTQPSKESAPAGPELDDRRGREARRLEHAALLGTPGDRRGARGVGDLRRRPRPCPRASAARTSWGRRRRYGEVIGDTAAADRRRPGPGRDGLPFMPGGRRGAVEGAAPARLVVYEFRAWC